MPKVKAEKKTRIHQEVAKQGELVGIMNSNKYRLKNNNSHFRDCIQQGLWPAHLEKSAGNHQHAREVCSSTN